MLQESVLKHSSLQESMSWIISGHLCKSQLGSHITQPALAELILAVYGEFPDLIDTLCLDLEAIKERDPAMRDFCSVILFFKGFLAIQAYRIANKLWRQDRVLLALAIQNALSVVFGVDIHPAARIGHGIVLDHATGVVIGETAVIGNNCSLFHEVTLGGTGKEKGDRHPKIGDNVMIGAGAKIFGNIIVGSGSKVAGGSVVLKDVPAHTTVAGIPAKVVGKPADDPANAMDQRIEDDGIGLFVW
eukprot:TRINITY_DN1069_c0_g1_i2.p1 TRINITY_DN1069_c0_g1~~TRINITY_DN1069_c0_g1_i2.p1  ORF type:complete len:284 (-),score=47.13 TRINITY_DN1069_c0_g1_i2:33-767(-)